jgi:hypothetical protein
VGGARAEADRAPGRSPAAPSPDGGGKHSRWPGSAEPSAAPQTVPPNDRSHAPALLASRLPPALTYRRTGAGLA